MIIAFCIPGFTEDNLRLQPWLTIYRVAENLESFGCDAHIITDGSSISSLGKFSIHSVRSLQGGNSHEINTVLHKLKPDSVITTVTPLSLLTSPWYQTLRSFRSFALFSYSFCTAKEIIKAFPHLNTNEKIAYGRQILVPGLFWGKILKYFFKGAICQSCRNGEVISRYSGHQYPVHAIPPGIDLENWSAEGKSAINGSSSSFLYAGWPTSIRGFYIALDALALLDSTDIRLKVLARGADEASLRKIMDIARDRGVESRVTIQGGWLTQDQFKRAVYSAAAVLMPFIVVPSEIPVTVLEAIACGTPVIASDIDGLPDAVGDAGIVVPHCDVIALATAMEKIHASKSFRLSLENACKQARNNMLSWEMVARQWLEAIGS